VRARRLGPGDADFAAETLRVVKGAGEDPSFGPEQLRAFLARPENLLIVAGEPGAPAGFLVAYALDRVDRARRMACLYEIEVAESRRGRGVGRALVDELLAWCRRERVMKAWVVTSRSNTAAVRLYETAGARPGAGDDDVVFVFEPIP
jgi:aminoglycoside 3-N-acetyltransferase I